MVRLRRRTNLPGAALSLLLASYSVVLFVHAGRSVGGSDSSGYFIAARALAARHPVERIEAPEALTDSPEPPQLFIPLGWVQGPRPGTMAPFYPIGLPLHFLGAAALCGWNVGPFIVSPLAAVASVLLIHLVARELGISPIGALAAAAMWATLPVLNFFAVQPMSDAVAASWALASVLFSLRSRRKARGLGWAAAAGLTFGVGVLLRPSSAVLIVPLAIALKGNGGSWLAFGAGGLPAAALFLGFNRFAYDGYFRTGYAAGGALEDFRLSNFPERFRHYGGWTAAMLSPLVPAAWLLFGADPRRPIRVRLLLTTWFAAFLLFYCFYGPYETWWYTRYLLPGFPALLLAAVMLAEDVMTGAFRGDSSPTRRRLRILRAGAGAAFLIVCLTGLRMGRRYDVLAIGASDSIYPRAVRWARSRVPPHSLVVAMQFSGAMKAYGLGTLVRWDWMQAERFPRFRGRMEKGGRRLYALLFPFEVAEAAPRLPGEWTYLGGLGEASLWRLEPPRD